MQDGRQPWAASSESPRLRDMVLIGAGSKVFLSNYPKSSLCRRANDAECWLFCERKVWIAKGIASCLLCIRLVNDLMRFWWFQWGTALREWLRRQTFLLAVNFCCAGWVVKFIDVQEQEFYQSTRAKTLNKDFIIKCMQENSASCGNNSFADKMVKVEKIAQGIQGNNKGEIKCWQRNGKNYILQYKSLHKLLK